ncbi:hypothetical protein evm_015255, partial [Chilo suppressalis]
MRHLTSRGAPWVQSTKNPLVRQLDESKNNGLRRSVPSSGEINRADVDDDDGDGNYSLLFVTAQEDSIASHTMHTYSFPTEFAAHLKSSPVPISVVIKTEKSVVSSAGTICVRYIVLYVHSPRLVPVIVTNLTTNKSKEIRSTLSEVLVLLLEKWSPLSVEKQQQVVRDAIRRACVDADSTARTYGR